MEQITESIIDFKVNGKPIHFKVYHDLPDIRGLRIEDALDNWLYRTEKYTAKSFVDYIRSKNAGHVAMTESQYKKASK